MQRKEDVPSSAACGRHLPLREGKKQQSGAHLYHHFVVPLSPAGSVPVWLSMSTGHRFTAKPRFAPLRREGLLGLFLFPVEAAAAHEFSHQRVERDLILNVGRLDVV